MTPDDTGRGLTLFTGAAVLLLVLWIPVNPVLHPGVNEYLLLGCMWIGIVYTLAMQSHAATGYPVILFPVFQGYMALTGYTVLQEAGFIISVFLGMLIYMVRIGKTPGNCIFDSMKTTLIYLLSLRITTFLLYQFHNRIFENEYLIASGLSIAVIMVMFQNQFFKFLFETTSLKVTGHAVRQFTQSIIFPGFFILFLLPAVSRSEDTFSNQREWNLIAGVLAILVIQTTLSAFLDSARFSDSRKKFLESGLRRHSEILATLDTSIEVLRVLASFWYRASEAKAVQVSWKNISMTYPTAAVTSRTPSLSRKGKEGFRLDIWPSENTILDKETIDIFILQTETVLKNLELRDSTFKSGWECLEAMVYSLDMSDRRKTGYSRIVADIAKEIGREMGLTAEALEDLEMSAMLHLTADILEKAEEDWQEAFASDPVRIQFELPPEVVKGIRHLTENFDGSGKPDNLREKSIPDISRILSVAINFVANLSNQSIDSSILELKRRSGLIYDPDIVEILENITLQKDRITFQDRSIFASRT